MTIPALALCEEDEHNQDNDFLFKGSAYVRMCCMDITRVRAIDPPDCDCMRCVLGEHIPLNSPYAKATFKAIMDGDITPPENNLPDATLIIYRTTRGAVQTVTNSEMVSRSDYIVIPAGGYDPPAEPDTSGLAIDVTNIKNEHEDMQEHLINSLIVGATYSNPSYSAFIAYRSPYGETGLIELPNSDSSEVTVIPYRE